MKFHHQQNQVVTEIHYGENNDASNSNTTKPAKVITTTQEYEAEIVLVTVPLGVLKDRYIH